MTAFTWMTSRLSGAAFLVAALVACPGPSVGNNDGGEDAGLDAGVDAGPQPISVNGKVTSETYAPVTGASIVVAYTGGSVTTTTDGNGAFTVANVVPPYDVLCYTAAAKKLLAYQGLSRPDPYLVFLTFSATDKYTATLAGSLSGSFPLASDNRQTVSFDSPVFAGSTSGISPSNVDGAFSSSVSWSESQVATGTLHALRWQVTGVSDFPVTYLGYGRRDNVSVLGGGTFSGNDITLNPITSGTLGGTLALAAGLTLTNLSVRLGFEGQRFSSLISVSNPSPSFNFVVPVISGSKLTLVANGSDVAGAQVAKVFGNLSPSTGLALSLPSPVSSSTPVGGATGVTASSTFSWNGIPNTVSGLLIAPTPSTAGTTIILFTAGASATVPNLSLLGLSLPANTSHTWQAISVGPITTMDALTAPPHGLVNGLSGPNADFLLSLSSQQTFTTAP